MSDITLTKGVIKNSITLETDLYNQDKFVYVGESVGLSVSATSNEGVPTITWSSSDTNIADSEIPFET